MSAYTPPTINNGDAFDPATVATGFANFATAINQAVDTNNLTTNTLPHRAFHKNALTETWVSSESGVVQSCPVRYAAAAGAGTTVIQTGRSFYMLNKFDVEDCSARIYLQHQADLLILASVDLKYAKTTRWSSGTPVFTHVVAGTITVDGSAQIARSTTTLETGADAHRRPTPITLMALDTSVPAGWHDVVTTLNFRTSTESTNAVDGFVHWLATGRALNIVALYR